VHVPANLEQRIAAIRQFNRFYTRQIGVLGEKLLDSSFSLMEVRILYEIAHRTDACASELSRELGVDSGYLSRILTSFGDQGLLERRASASDARRILLKLTPQGEQVFADLNARANNEIAELLERLTPEQQQQVVHAMRNVMRVFEPEARPTIVLRGPEAGDLGWVVHRHGMLYAQEYGWDARFEALVAGIVAAFVENFDAKRERCWIAEKDGEPVGSVFLVKKSESVAKLRLLLVEPSARGLGIGSRLVAECIRFGRQAGYQSITLWTNDILHAARRIYEREGFRLVQEEPHNSFGDGLIGQYWELTL
jgi:DNA-binding MarR family transcriptional regulator/N-acetylglutamate synthase-like GNAT family acetyltransferase